MNTSFRLSSLAGTFSLLAIFFMGSLELSVKIKAFLGTCCSGETGHRISSLIEHKGLLFKGLLASNSSKFGASLCPNSPAIALASSSNRSQSVKALGLSMSTNRPI